MANDKVKVVGYAQRVFYDNGIEYRNFSDDLVGNQFASEAVAPLFTIANFNITTNLERRQSRLFNQNRFSSFFCMADLTQETSIDVQDIVDANLNIKLKLDKSNLCNYAYFGSMVEFMRVALEEIIMKWPASLSVSQFKDTTAATGLTAEDYVYDVLEETAIFRVPTNSITNKFNINYLNNGVVIALNTGEVDIKNMPVTFESYVIDINNSQHKVIGFTGATQTDDDYIYFEVEGNPFTASTSVTSYHIRPNNDIVELFFSMLPDFEAYLLNRDTIPNYTAVFRYPFRTDDGIIQYRESELTWPATDGYNIDFDTAKYTIFVSELLDLAVSFDDNKTDIVARQLVSESISDFDTFPRCDGGEEVSEGQKINRTLRIYGREFDEIKRYIDGIKFTNTVTYDKKDNTPDAVLKYLAKTLGWGMITSVLEDDLLMTYLRPSDPSYSGQTRGLTPYEAEIEMWRRIILNSPWIWKSKGHRKVIEFFLKFIGTPRDLIQFNEYVWVAKKPVDVELIKDVMEELGYDSTFIDNLNFDSEGYPKAHRNGFNGMYFQKGGLWYRETGGPASAVDITTGNNPHVGPYDGGKEYIDQFRCLIPDFSAVTITREDISTEIQNIFTNYNSGLVNNSTDDVSYDILNNDGVPIEECFEIYGEIIEDPQPTTEITDCGCETGEGDDAIRFSIIKAEPEEEIDCGYSAFTFQDDGFITFTLYNGKESFAIPVECCEAIGQTPVMVDGAWWCMWNDTILGCEGYQDWAIQTDGIVIWLDPSGEETTIVPSAECCDIRKEYVAIPSPVGGFQCVIPCTGLQGWQITTEGLVIWLQPNGTTTTTVPFAECCERDGFTAVQVNKDGTEWECYITKPAECHSWEIVAVQIDGIAVWQPSGGGPTTIEVSDPECCERNGYTAVPSPFSKDSWNCLFEQGGPAGEEDTGLVSPAPNTNTRR